MPKCVDCGKESPRAEMFGMAEDLRCADCAQRRRRVWHRRQEIVQDAPPIWSFSIVFFAATIFAAQNAPGVHYVDYLSASPFEIWNGQVWRLATTMLPHVNIFHLLFNCYALWMLGPPIERVLGHTRFVGLILLLAVFAHATEFLFEPTTAVGLSGVVYGLFGYLYALRLYRDYAARVIHLALVKQFVGWFFLCIFLTAVGAWHVANVAHGAGAAMGYVVGRASMQKQWKLYLAALASATALLPLCVLYMPWNSNYAFYRMQKAAHAQDASAMAEWANKINFRDLMRMAAPADNE